MTKKFAQFAMLIVAAFAFTSCGDSKESVVDDTISTMNEAAEAANSGDTEKLAKLEKKLEELKKRGEELGIDEKFIESLSDDKQKELMQAAIKYGASKMKNIGADLKNSLEGIGQ